MATRLDRPRGGRGAKRPRDPATYYATSSSDRSYAREARDRVNRRARRQWLIRLLVLAVLAVAARLWGPSLVDALTARASETAEDWQEVGEHIKDGTAHRAGAGLDE